jgi:uncharacterized protein (TIRG00374 family)
MAVLPPDTSPSALARSSLDVPPLSGETSTVSLILGWGVGVLVLAGLISFILHFGDIGVFIDKLKAADPLWLAAALGSQAITYVCAALIWARVMAKAGYHRRVVDLLDLAVVELFANQAIPTGGLSGSVIVVRGLIRRAVPSPIAVTALLIAALSYYGAYLLIAIAAFVLLWYSGDLSDAWLSLSIVFAGVVIFIGGSLLLLMRLRGRFIPTSLLSWPPAKRIAEMLSRVRRDLVADASLLTQTTALQAAIFLLDAATLWLVLQAIGTQIVPSHAFISFVLASVVATLSPLPLGLGSFEGTCVAVLHLLGVQIEAGLAATLIFRGFTFWLPMLPGIWLIRREANAVQ